VVTLLAGRLDGTVLTFAHGMTAAPLARPEPIGG
jgi:hypothetical protein